MENNNGLDSSMMNQILKGDAFPDDESGAFLTNSINTFFEELFSHTDHTKSSIIRDANIPRTYGYQILNGSRIAHRDYYLRIAIAMKLDLRTTQRLLAVTQTGGLHSLIRRDAAIMFAINHEYDNIQTYDFMLKLGVAPLEKDETGDEPGKSDQSDIDE